MQEQALRHEEAIRVLLVDDEAGILLTLSDILQQHGYDVTAMGTVKDALAQITSAQFEVLIADLNIDEPGDGFTVVSAIRQTQPSCITLILTGYPGFDSALEAIRSQVDDYLVKPTPPSTLIQLIEQKLRNPKSGTGAATKRISQVLRENTFEITQRTLNAMKSDPAFVAIPITDEQRIEHTARTIEELAKVLEPAEPEQATRDFVQGAAIHGARRYQLCYTIPLLAGHVRLLEHAIYDVIHEHLLSLNLIYFMSDLKRLNDSLGLQLEHTILAFLNVEQRLHQQQKAQ